MGEQPHHHCGVVAVTDLTGKRDVVPAALDIALQLRHRGQLAWGRAGVSLDRRTLWHATEQKAISEHDVQRAKETDARSAAVIAHTRYATDHCLQMAHPVVVADPARKHPTIAFAFNGNIPDTSLQEAELKCEGITVAPGSDTEVIAHLLALRMRQRGLYEAIQSLGELDGAMNGVVLVEDGTIAAFRDRHGFHPLVTARWDDMVAIASEEQAIRTAWEECSQVYDVAAGQLMTIQPGSPPRTEQLWEPQLSHCFFEWTYFSKRLSTHDGARVENARYIWGEILADLDAHWTEKRLIVPVPQSAVIAAWGYRDRSRQRYYDLLTVVQDRDDRTFIEPGDRERKVLEKFDIDRETARNKPIVLIEDSIVRGTTMRFLIDRLRKEACPAAIHLRIACPPIMHPCYYGIDFKTREELLVPKHTRLPLRADGTLPPVILDAIARDFGVNSIKYLPFHALSRGIRKPSEHLCTACVTGHYPTLKGRELSAREFQRPGMRSLEMV